jgi:hypothetical protein
MPAICMVSFVLRKFLFEENSHNHYMWLHAPLSLPEYGGKKKNVNPAWNRCPDVWAVHEKYG